jgi:hypothetical protein
VEQKNDFQTIAGTSLPKIRAASKIYSKINQIKIKYFSIPPRSSASAINYIQKMAIFFSSKTTHCI